MKRLLAMVVISLFTNVAVGVLLCNLVDDDARDFRVMRTISSEPAARAIVKHLGNSVARYYPGDENIISPGLGCKQFRISGSVYRYDTPNVLYYIYVDTLGFVENVYCKPAKNQR